MNDEYSKSDEEFHEQVRRPFVRTIEHHTVIPEPMPEYVSPRDDVPPVGALSAEAIVKDFEKTAKDIEAMATAMTEAAQRCATELMELTTKYKEMAEDVRMTVEAVKDTAAAYRDEAKSVFVRIEDTSLMTKEMRELSARMRNRITGKVDVTTTPPDLEL